MEAEGSLPHLNDPAPCS